MKKKGLKILIALACLFSAGTLTFAACGGGSRASEDLSAVTSSGDGGESAASGSSSSSDTSGGGVQQEYYTVTFDADGGSFGTESKREIIVKNGSAVEAISAPEKEGFVFDHWALDGSEYSFSSPVTADITLKAVYREAEYTLSFTPTEGVTYRRLTGEGDTAKKGTEVSFSVELGAYYAGFASVTVNGEPIADADGVYSFTVGGDCVVEVNGVLRDVSAMSGAGTLSNPYIVTKPIDFAYIAEQVNGGNSKYVRACYKLGCDVDFKGEALKIIGDYSTSYSYFSGYFEGDGYTISNFVIDASDKPYVGVFGYVIAGISDDYSATISNVALENYTVTASVNGSMLAVGSLVGYGVGANVYACRMENGVIDVYADTSYFAYAGGVFGVQQSAFSESYNLRCYSSVSYTTANVEINANAGYVLCAGGVSGYLVSNEDATTAYIVNSYSDSVVTGAIRSGGIVGYMGDHTAVANCYSSGDVNAQTGMSDVDFYEQYCYAYAGGIAGFAENDTAISDCFAAGSVSAVASLGAAYSRAAGLVGGMYSADGYPEPDSRAGVVLNCYYAENGKDGEIDLKDPAFLKQNLKWKDSDWIFAENGYPAVRYEDAVSPFTVTLSVGGVETRVDMDGDGAYMPIAYRYLSGELDEFAEKDETSRTYGWYFDEALTQKVPYGYLVTRDITLYGKYVDYGDVAGTYYLLVGDVTDPVELVLRTDGTYLYRNGGMRSVAEYTYDGSTIYLYDCRLARFAENGVTEIMTFAGKKSEGELILYDGTYFTAENPAVASSEVGIYGEYYVKNGSVVTVYTFYVNYTGVRTTGSRRESFTYSTDGASISVYLPGETITGSTADGIVLGGVRLSVFDEYRGVWELGSSSHKTYTFDGMGAWQYEEYGYRRTTDDQKVTTATKYVISASSGTYTAREDGSLLLSDGTEVRFDENGFVVVDYSSHTSVYYAEGSFCGTWTDEYIGVTLYLNGIAKDGVGYAYAVYDNGESYYLSYVYGEDGYCTLYSASSVFGFLYYEPSADMLYASLYWSQSGYMVDDFNLSRYDDYTGEWISDDEVFSIVDFNGFGSYDVNFLLSDGTRWIVEGYVVIDGERVRYYLDDSTLGGRFTYRGVTYSIVYDEATQTVLVTDGENTSVLERKDEFADIVLTDGNGALYTFDGRGGLASGGRLTVTTASGETVYTYRVLEGRLGLFDGGTEIGSIAVSDDLYLCTVNGAGTLLYIDNYFTGDWAVSGSMSVLSIGKLGASGEIAGRFKDVDVTFVYESAGHLSFTWNGTRFYVIALADGGLAISPYIDLYYGDYILCAELDEVFGEWTDGNGVTYTFDGMSNSGYTYGYILRTEGDKNETLYYVSDGAGGIVAWGGETDENGSAVMYKLTYVSKDTEGAFVKGEEAFVWERIDALYRLTATDANGVTYTFDGMGAAAASDGTEYAYRILSVDGEAKLAEVVLTDGAGNTRQAVIDYSGENAVITFNS